MMKNSLDVLAHCLAAEDHPHLWEEPDFQQAKAALDASPELQAELEQVKAFFARHPVLIDASGMPSDVRERIAAALKAQAAPPAGQEILGPWQVRRQFAWAASLVLLLTGMAYLSSRVVTEQERGERRLVLQNMPPQDAFRSEVGRLVQSGFALQQRSANPMQLVAWLNDQGLSRARPPEGLVANPSMGCAQFEAPFGKIAVICFDASGEVYHLFYACAKQMGLESRSPPQQFQLQGRRVLQWSDDETLYLLIPQEEETELPEIFL